MQLNCNLINENVRDRGLAKTRHATDNPKPYPYMTVGHRQIKGVDWVNSSRHLTDTGRVSIKQHIRLVHSQKMFD